MKKAYIIIGVNQGDEGKGSIVDYLCSREKINAVIRFNGGFQAAHNVVNKGRHHTFSQFGSGSFWDVPTYLTEDVITCPFSMLTEHSNLFKLKLNPKIYVHEECLVSTVYHLKANRLIDQSNHHGSCGVGIGLTRKMWSQTGDGLFWGDLRSKSTVKRKLRWIRQWCQDELLRDYKDPILSKIDTPIPIENEAEDITYAYTLLYKNCLKYFDDTCDLYSKDWSGTVVFEGAQGLKLDEVHGTIPHTTYSDTTPRRAIDLCPKTTQRILIGVTRSYETRHGNGPMFNEHSRIDLANDHNFDNGSFSGKFRQGDLDKTYIYSLQNKFDVLAVTCLDHLNIDTDFGFKQVIKSYGPEYTDKVWENGV